MRRLLMVLLMLTLAGTAMASVTGSVNPNLKPDNSGIYVNPPTRVTGDTVADPFFVTEPLPFMATGTTVGFTHDYNEVCPYSTPGSPDVVYSFTPTNAALLAINIDLCYSSYDTKLYVYQDAVTPGAPLACNDDYYFAAPCYTYSSFLGMVPVSVGHTYYIVIDGYGSGSAGNYQIDVTDGGVPPPYGACCYASGSCAFTTQVGCTGIWQGENTLCEPNPCPPPPPVECPAGSLTEVEDNGGCNSTPQVWNPINPQEAGCATMCGTGWANTSSRDTDWFVSIGTGATMTGTAVAEFPLQYILIYGADCAALSYVIGTGDPGVPVTLSYVIADGEEVWNWIGTSVFEDWAESDYVLDVCGIKNPPPPPGACCRNGLCMVMEQELCLFVGGTFTAPGVLCDPNPCEPVPTENKSWGQLKNLYR